MVFKQSLRDLVLDHIIAQVGDICKKIEGDE